MALTDYQRSILALLADHRISQDIDLFHDTQVEVDGLSFEGGAPVAAELSVRWKAMLAEARRIVAALATEEVGTCVLDAEGGLFRGNQELLAGAIAGGRLRFHRGAIRGSIPRFIDH